MCLHVSPSPATTRHPLLPPRVTQVLWEETYNKYCTGYGNTFVPYASMAECKAGCTLSRSCEYCVYNCGSKTYHGTTECPQRVASVCGSIILAKVPGTSSLGPV